MRGPSGTEDDVIAGSAETEDNARPAIYAPTTGTCLRNSVLRKYAVQKDAEHDRPARNESKDCHANRKRLNQVDIGIHLQVLLSHAN